MSFDQYFCIILFQPLDHPFNNHSILYLYGCNFSKFHIQVRSGGICFLCLSSFHFSLKSCRSIYVVANDKISLLLWMYGILVCAFPTFSASIYPLMNTWFDSLPQLHFLWITHSSTSTFSAYMQFSNLF